MEVFHGKNIAGDLVVCDDELSSCYGRKYGA
jgi:hypothetical protein